MKFELQYGKDTFFLDLPDECAVYQSNYKKNSKKASDLMLESLANPIESNLLSNLLRNRKAGKVVIVVSDITRPIPYTDFLPELLTYIESSGIKKDEIIILVATGMHRSSTHEEHIKMFGEFVVENYRIIDHNCEKEEELYELDSESWSGSKVRLNKHYVEAGFRIVTGLVEPHFMAGFSGGRKAICPGIVSLDAVQKFHGYHFLNNPNSSNAVLKDNPCHLENTSIARMCPPNFAIHLVLDKNKKINSIFSGELFVSHQKAIDLVKSSCCPVVLEKSDIAITSGGGYPLDETFYQCVKSFINCLPAIKERGQIISFGSCKEGIGSPEYINLMKKYSGTHQQFIDDIKENRIFVKDQWQFQMHIRALNKVGVNNLHFYTSEISASDLSKLSVNPHSVPIDDIEKSIQNHINKLVKEKKRISIFPEGPYCSPIEEYDV